MANEWIKLVLLGLTSCGATATRPNGVATSFAAPRANFGAYQTFSFGLAEQPKPGYEVTPRSLEVARRLQSLVVHALRARGYSDKLDGADFVVKLTAGSRSSPTPSNGGADVFGETNAPKQSVALGYIGINIYDAKTGVQVWQGTAFAEVDPKDIDDALLERGVTHMLQSFPARRPLLANAP